MVIVISLIKGSCLTRLRHDPNFFPSLPLIVLFLWSTIPAAQCQLRTIAPGIEYEEHRLLDPNTVHVVRVNRASGWQFGLGFPDGKKNFHARETTREIYEEYDEPPCFDVVAALNASFFQMDGTAIEGALASQGDFIQKPSGQTETLALLPGGEWIVAETAVLDAANLQTERGESKRLDRINEVRLPETLAYYSDVWGVSTETTQPGIEVVVESVAPESDQVGEKSGAVTRMMNGPDARGSAIPDEGFVLSARGAEAEWVQQTLRIGDRLTASFAFTPKKLDTAELLLGVKGWLVKNGELNRAAWSRYPETFTSNRHPRSCLAWNEETFFLVAVDGRQVTSWGMTFEELARFVHEKLGADEAVNLDGGGSTTLVVEGKLMNRPSDPYGERPVGNALLVWKQDLNPESDCGRLRKSDIFR